MNQNMYTFQYRKPRYANPTFLSSNVGFSLRSYNPEEPSFKNKVTSYQKDYQRGSNSNIILPKLNSIHNIKQQQIHSSLPKIQKNQQYKLNIQVDKKNSQKMQSKQLKNIPYQAQQPEKRIASETIQEQSSSRKVRFAQSKQQKSQIKEQKSPKNNIYYIQKEPIFKSQQMTPTRVQSHQRLPYNNNSNNLLRIIQERKILLSKLRFTQKDISKKQLTSYNIINLQPKEYDQTIKQYPKLTLEDKDEYFGKRFRKALEDKNLYQSRFANIHSRQNFDAEKISINMYNEHALNHAKKNNLPIAGVHTYKVHQDEHDTNLAYNKNNEQAHQHSKEQHFDMKLLNIADQWTN